MSKRTQYGWCGTCGTKTQRNPLGACMNCVKRTMTRMTAIDDAPGTSTGSVVCNRCFGYLDMKDTMFCRNCLADIQTGKTSSQREQSIKDAAKLAEKVTFPWVTMENGLTRMLSNEEICPNCGKAPGSTTPGTWCWGCLDELKVRQIAVMMTDVTLGDVGTQSQPEPEPTADSKQERKITLEDD